MSVRPAKTQISLGIRPIWPESSLCAQWVAKDPSFLQADNEDSDQRRRLPRLIWVFAGRTVTLLILSCRGSYAIWFSCIICMHFCLCMFAFSCCHAMVKNTNYQVTDCSSVWISTISLEDVSRFIHCSQLAVSLLCLSAVFPRHDVTPIPEVHAPLSWWVGWPKRPETYARSP